MSDEMRRIRQIKNGLNSAFKALRKQNIIARQNYECCRSCGWSSITLHIEKISEDARDRVAGAVFYSSQDNRSMISGLGLCISYGNIETRYGVIGKPDDEIGGMVVKALRAAGLSVEWDGDVRSRIKVV